MNTDLPVPVIVLIFWLSTRPFECQIVPKNQTINSSRPPERSVVKCYTKKSKDYKTEGQSRIVLFAVYFSVTSRLVDVVT